MANRLFILNFATEPYCDFIYTKKTTGYNLLSFSCAFGIIAL
ncbi:hypothetical protein [Kurthia sibirica]|nr:hypothetical protein [Kurthia sibirica]